MFNIQKEAGFVPVSPPISVFDARSGDWQARKRWWISIGIKSEVGRGDNALGFSDTVRKSGKQRQKNFINGTLFRSDSGCDPAFYKQKKEWEFRLGRKLSTGEFQEKYYKHIEEDSQIASGTSIFDPVLCEHLYSWFCPERGQIVDPFCGGSVRGIVAAKLGRRYWGCDLRQEQVDANVVQAKAICPEAVGNGLSWVCGDSIQTLGAAPPADFLFSCPPYGSLEKYGEDPRDLANMTPGAFDECHGTIIRKACERLKNNRFACWVVAEYRVADGSYAGFVPNTIFWFENAGLRLYNEAILLTPMGSLPIRMCKQFEVSRKLGKSHQNILIFVKGDWKKAAAFAAGRGSDT